VSIVQCVLSIVWSVVSSRRSVLIEGVLFRARYLGSTQLISEGQPSKAVRMLQAQEAIARIKVRATDDVLRTYQTDRQTDRQTD